MIANSGTKIVLRCDHPRDVDFTSKLLQVEARWVSKIPVGHGIARLATRYYQSFLFTFPEQPLKNTLISEARVQERYAQWATGLISNRARQNPELSAALRDLEQWARVTINAKSPGENLSLGVRDGQTAGAEDGEAGSSTAITVARTDAADGINEKERTLLADIAAHPISTITERYARLHWNPKTGNAVKDTLVGRGMIAFAVLPVLKSRVTLLALTPIGETLLRERGIVLRSSGRAGLEHEFWRQRIKERCEGRGYTVVVEHHLGGGKHVDLYAHRRNQRFIIEIETGKSDVLGNVAKCKGTSARMIVFFTSTDVLQAHTGKLPAEVTALCPTTLDDLHCMLNAAAPR